MLVGYGLFLLSAIRRRVVRAVSQRWLVSGQARRSIGAVLPVVWGPGGLPA